jgi:hypothetical protein
VSDRVDARGQPADDRDPGFGQVPGDGLGGADALRCGLACPDDGHRPPVGGKLASGEHQRWHLVDIA